MFYTNVSMIGDNILYRGVKDGKRIRQKIKYKPKLYVKSEKGKKWQTLFKEPLEEMQFDTIRDARNFVKQYEDVSNFPIYGQTRYDSAFLSDMFPDEVDWDISKITIAYTDIEVESNDGFPKPEIAAQAITAITLHIHGKYYTFGCGDYVPHRDDVVYTKCADEFELIEKFIDLWTQYYPDIVTGWNVKFFDFPYLINRIVKLFGEEKAMKLSPWGKINESKSNYKGRDVICYNIMGIAILDYMELYRKYSSNPNQESYSLNNIAYVELGEKKTDYSDYENLNDLYLRNHQLFIEYNIRDVELPERMEDKLRLIELAMTLAYDAKVNYEEVFSQVRMWDTITCNTLKKKHIVIPPKRNSKKDQQYAGAFVKDPIIGMHKWVASFDLNSLYPHLIMMYNLSPETLMDVMHYPDALREFMSYNARNITVDKLLDKLVDTSILKEHHVTLTPNAQLFSIEKQGFLSEIMETMYEDRSIYKAKTIEARKRKEVAVSEQEKNELDKQIAKYNNIQLAKKVTLNSAYGAIGNPYFRFYDIRIAEAITLSGQLSIRWIEQKINGYLNEMLKTTDVDYIIASDTDSIYINLGGVVDSFIENQDNRLKVIRMLDKFCENKLQKFIDASYQELKEYLNAYAQKMVMKREALADRAIWTAKKHYLINVYNNEGVEYKKPKLKIMGLQAIQSSTPQSCRQKIKESFELIISKDEAFVMKFIQDFRVHFKTLPIDEIAFPRGINGIEKYADSHTIYGFKTPFHVKGALYYNYNLKKHNLDKKYPQIQDGDKIKFIHLKEPNPIQSPVIAFTNVIPKEFDLEKYIDYNTQFDKAFLEPLKAVLTAIGWKSEKTSSLESLFA